MAHEGLKNPSIVKGRNMKENGAYERDIRMTTVIIIRTSSLPSTLSKLIFSTKSERMIISHILLAQSRCLLK